jgi:hypothetical protein
MEDTFFMDEFNEIKTHRYVFYPRDENLTLKSIFQASRDKQVLVEYVERMNKEINRLKEQLNRVNSKEAQ